MSKVSVIIPVYNAASFLQESIVCARDQTYPDIEIIVVDDHSTDGSYELALGFQSEKIIVVRNDRKGACAARNYGLQLSSGVYIQYLDADDLLSQDKIEKQVGALENENLKLAVCETWKFKTSPLDAFNTDKNYLFSTDKPEEFFIHLWGGNGQLPHMVQTNAWLVPRTLIEKAGPWDENLVKDQDGEFFARVAMQSEGIIYLPTIKNFYRIHSSGDNISSKKERVHVKSQLQALISKESQLLKKTNSKNFQRSMALQYKWLAIDSWLHFRDISSLAFSKMNQYGGSDHTPNLGGKVVEAVNRIFGWKAAIYFSYYGHKIFRFKVKK